MERLEERHNAPMIKAIKNITVKNYRRALVKKDEAELFRWEEKAKELITSIGEKEDSYYWVHTPNSEKMCVILNNKKLYLPNKKINSYPMRGIVCFDNKEITVDITPLEEELNNQLILSQLFIFVNRLYLGLDYNEKVAGYKLEIV